MSPKRACRFLIIPEFIPIKRRSYYLLLMKLPRGEHLFFKLMCMTEDALAEFSGAEFAIGVGNATDGLELACLSQNLSTGDEVIFCSHTMVATASAIKTAGAIPIPVEIGHDGLIDPAAVADAVTSRTVGIIPTQLNGAVCNMQQVSAIAEKHGLFLIEDAAQALGAKYHGQQAGTFGLAAAISFYPAKVLGSLGDGGAVFCNDARVYDKIYQLHEHGRDRDGQLKGWGRNSRLDNIQAAILRHNLRTYDQIVEKRRTVANRYHEQLSSLEELTLPRPQTENSVYYDVFQNYELQAENRDQLKEFLHQNGIGTLLQWGGKAVHQWEVLGFTQELPKTELF